MAIDFPATPGTDQVYPASNGVNYFWDGEKWTTKQTSRNSSLGSNPGDNPPPNPVEGDFWYNTLTHQLYVRVGAGWEKAALPDTQYADDLP